MVPGSLRSRLAEALSLAAPPGSERVLRRGFWADASELGGDASVTELFPATPR